MLKPYRTVQDVLSSPWAQVQRVKRSPQQTDRVLRSTKLEDSIYRDLRMEDTGMDEIENSAGEKLRSFPALSRDIFQSFYSLMPRRNADDDLSVAARKINVPILEHITQSDDYPTLKAVCEGRELPAYEAAAEFTAQTSGELDNLLSQLGGKPGAVQTLEKLEQAEKTAEDKLAALLEQLRGAPQDDPALSAAVVKAANDAESKRRQADAVNKLVDAGLAQNQAEAGALIARAVSAAAERAEEVQTILGAWSDAPGDMRKTDANAALLERVRDSKTLQDISRYLGRFREIFAQGKRNGYAYGRGEKYALELGNDLSRALTSELAMLAVPETLPLFLRKYQHRQIKQYRRREPVYKGAGDIICCLDESGSISAQDTTDLSDTCAQIALPAILIRLLDAVIRRGELSKNEHSQLCQLRSTLCERFVLSFKALDESDPLQTKYCLFFSLALSMLARDYRTGVAGTRDLIKCAGYAQQCINGEKKLNIPKADGYLQVALCLNARMEDMLNVTDTKMNGTLPFSSQLADAVREAVRDYHEGSMYKRDEAVRTFRRNLFPRWKPGLGNVLACCDIFQIILEAAYEKYVSAANQNNQNYQEIARLGYVSKAYLVLAAIGTSGGALNLLAQMLINQANQYEADQRISFFRRHPDIDTFVQQHAAPYGWPLNDNYALAYRVLQSVCGIQRGSQPYSHMKKAELVLKGYVSESSSTQLTSLNIAINGGLAMGHYWKGRLLLEQAKQDHDRCNDYKDAAIASFCATNVTERFDHLPENADEDAAPQLSPPQWLSAIELLRYPDRAVFRVDRRMVFQTIYQKLTQQVEEVQSDNIQIHNERYRLTKKDVRSNLERCLDMVKAQFPDKEPLIQKMIRSIR